MFAHMMDTILDLATEIGESHGEQDGRSYKRDTFSSQDEILEALVPIIDIDEIDLAELHVLDSQHDISDTYTDAYADGWNYGRDQRRAGRGLVRAGLDHATAAA